MTRTADWRLAVVAGAAAGLAASPFWDPGGDWFRPLAAAVLVTSLLAGRTGTGLPALVVLAAAAALAGLLVGGARIAAIDGQAIGQQEGKVKLTGFAEEPPSDSRGVARFSFRAGQGRMLVEVDSNEAGGIGAGTGLEIEGTLAPAPDWLAAGLEARGLFTILKAARVIPSGKARGGITGLIDRLRSRADAALGVAVPDREAALSRGFVLGDESGIDKRTSEDFRRSGLSHLLAVSGQNVVLLALLAMPFLALAGLSPPARLIATGALILIYVPLAGGGPSIQRAGVMGIAGLVALAATRAPSRIYALGLAALVTLLLNPRASAEIGWQLSFVAVAGIMLLARPLQRRLTGLLGSRGWRGLLSEGVAVTLAATIATAPLTVFHFERLPVASLVANVAAMPAVAPAMWMGMISVAVGQISPILAAPFNLAGSLCLAWIAQVAEWFGRPGWAVIEVSIGGVGSLLLISGLLAAVSFTVLRLWHPDPVPLRPGPWMAVVAAMALAAVLLLPGLTDQGRRSLAAPPTGGARVEVLDIGQGDAILIRPWNAEPVLIDGGPPGGDLTGALDSAGVDHLAAVLLTHPDLDHYGGLLDLFGLVRIDRFLFEAAPAEMISLARASGASLQRVGAGQMLRDGNIGLELLWPPPSEASNGNSGTVAADADTDPNLRSIVALLKWRDFRMLLTGDAEAEAVPMDPGPIDVLKVSHHGSEDTGLPSLLDRISPRVAVIPVGEDNPYGHPVPDVLGELAADGVEILRTDQDGTVSIILSGDNYEIETGR